MKSFCSTSLAAHNLPVEESLFMLGNGYLGVRGNFEEGYSDNIEEIRGTYINGLYAHVDVQYPEIAYGFPVIADKQPRIFDSQTIRIWLDGEEVSLFSGISSAYKRELFLEKGYSVRSFQYQTKKKKIASICFTRLVSMIYPEVFAISIEIDFDGDIRVESLLETEVENYTNKNDPRVSSSHAKLLSTSRREIDPSNFGFPDLYCEAEIKNSGLSVGCRTGHVFMGDPPFEVNTFDDNHGFGIDCTINGSFHMIKLNTYGDSLRHKNLHTNLKKILNTIKKLGWISLVESQVEFYKNFWKTSNITIRGNDELQLAIHYSIFQLFQSVGKDSFSNISAKGLSGEGYEGHYFWDTEIYVFPYYLVSQPQIAKNLLEFRYKQLPAAKKEARLLGARRGVKFPWRSISGIECSTFFPAGQAQYHINGDVCYSLVQYYLATDDEVFIREKGLRILLESCLFFLEIGHFRNSVFCIDRVTGPDEYTAIVNNNFYTNMLVKYAFFWLIKLISKFFPDDQEKELFLNHSDANLADLEKIKKAEENILLPHDKEKNIDLQDENFLQLRQWSEEDDRRPLLLHYHPLRIYSAQILKQPDTVLAHFLNEDVVTEDCMRSTFHYYEAITTHDSSLSTCLYGIMACRIHEMKKAADYFMDSVYLDIQNTHQNTKDGLHMANLAGSAMYMIYGFAGLRIKETGLFFNPVLPDLFSSYSFYYHYKNRVFFIQIENKIEISLIEGDPETITIYGTPFHITKTQTIRIPLR